MLLSLSSPWVHGKALGLLLGICSVCGVFGLAHVKFWDQGWWDFFLILQIIWVLHLQLRSQLSIIMETHSSVRSLLTVQVSGGAQKGIQVPRREKTPMLYLTMLCPMCRRHCNLGMSRVWVFYSKCGCKFAWAHHGHCWPLIFPVRLEKNRIFCLSRQVTRRIWGRKEICDVLWNWYAWKRTTWQIW